MSPSEQTLMVFLIGLLFLSSPLLITTFSRHLEAAINTSLKDMIGAH